MLQSENERNDIKKKLLKPKEVKNIIDMVLQARLATMEVGLLFKQIFKIVKRIKRDEEKIMEKKKEAALLNPVV